MFEKEGPQMVPDSHGGERKTTTGLGNAKWSEGRRL